MAFFNALTETKIRTEKPGIKPKKLMDGHGLFLLVQPNGAKLWRYKYDFNRKQKLMALGAYPVVTLLMARKLHAEARRKLAAGTDPMAERKEEKTGEETGTKFGEVAALWLPHWRVGKSPDYVEDVERFLDADILPALGKRPVDQITAPEIVSMVRAIEGRGAREIAQRAYEKTSEIFRYGIAEFLATRNPAAEVRARDILKPRAELQKNFARVELQELPRLLRDIEAHRGNNLTRLAMKLMALTFVRTGELVKASKSEFNLDAARWDIPAPRMKTRRPHIVPLSRQAVEILRTLFAMSTDDAVFPGDAGQEYMSNNTILMALYRMGYKGEQTGHGFRGIASTALYESGLFEESWIETQLAHISGNGNKTRRAYDHAKFLPQRTAMMQWWADYVDQTRSGGKIIPFVA